MSTVGGQAESVKSSTHSNMSTASGHSSSNISSTHSHHTSKPANHTLLQTPTENPLKIASDEPDSKDYSNHSSTAYERKKHPPNPNRKHYTSSGPYRGSMNPALNNHSNSNSSVTPNNSSSNNNNNNNNINQTSSLAGNATSVGIRKGPLIHQPAAESNGMLTIATKSKWFLFFKEFEWK